MDAKTKKFETILTSKYSIDNFKEFVAEFFNDLCWGIDEAKTDYWNWSEFSAFIKKYQHIASYTDKDNNKIGIFSVEMEKGQNIDRSRSAQRNFAKKLIESNNLQAALVAFYSLDEYEKWRLSFIKLDYEFASGKLQDKLTPAKRYSYLVGVKEPCHTAQKRLLAILKNEETNPTLSEIEESFSVEKITKEFFDQYKKKYIQLKEHLEMNTVFIDEANKHNFTSEQFAKKLMGQIAFLYFVQKKGWLGVNALPKIISNKQYKDAYYSLPLAKRYIIENVYKQINTEEYRISASHVNNLTEDEDKLLARVMKGENWGTGPRNFMRQLFNDCTNKNRNFFDDYLEPLFYEALNKSREENAYYSRLHCKIPFLNGGLFEPLDNYDWENNAFDIPNEMFSNKEKKGEWDADGILDIFDRYNFTINEDEPLEKEVAVDPEMLGKIFENLLDIKDRKSKGAFYTPREIVHYMCQESLVNYLLNETKLPYEALQDFILFGEFMKDNDTALDVKKGVSNMLISKSILDGYFEPINSNLESRNYFIPTVNRLFDIDKALANIKVCDPAVGSGAFPLGMVNEIVKARINITSYLALMEKNSQNRLILHKGTRDPYMLKLDTIKNSIFAVDIEPSAVDITKLRLWLSLVVDAETDSNADEYSFFATTKNPRPLPNLDCNIRCGNSLIDEINGVKLYKESFLLNSDDYQTSFGTQDIYEEVLNKLFELQDKLFSEKDHDEKENLKIQINKIKDYLILNEVKGTVAEEEYNKIKNNTSLPYFVWKIEFAKVFKDKGGFDIVIGNPPYVKEYTNSSIFKNLKTSKYYQGKMDFWYFFACLGIDIMKFNGIQTFIAPNNWVTNFGGSILRNKILKETEINKYIDFGNYKVFDTASIQTMIYVITKKNNVVKEYPLYYSKLLQDKISIRELTDFLYSSVKFKLYQKSKYNFTPESYFDKIISFNDNSTIIKKMKLIKSSSLLKNEIAQGIVAPQENLNAKNAKILGEGYKVGEGIFVLTNDEIETLGFKNQDLIKPFYTTNEVNKYYTTKDSKFSIIYTESNIDNIIDKYPLIKEHLNRFQKIITSDNRPYGLHRSRNKSFFEGEKILVPRKVNQPVFSYADFDTYVSQTFNIIKPNNCNIKFLLGFLNSKIVKYWLKNMGKLQGNNYQLDKEPLLNIPIIIPDNNSEKNIISIVDKIIEVKKTNPDKDTLELESEIDNIIYDLYGLTEEEIKIVEESIK